MSDGHEKVLRTTSTFHINPFTGATITESDVRYVTQNVLLITEDNPTLLTALISSANRVFRTKTKDQQTANDLVKMCATNSVPSVQKHLGLYQQHSPSARLYASLDLNMGLNEESGNRRPTEALFYDPLFQHFMKNGGAIVMYTGFPEQVLGSEAIMRSHQEYAHSALFVANKGDPAVTHDKVFYLLANAVVHPDQQRTLRTMAERYNHNLGAIFRDLDQRRTRR